MKHTTDEEKHLATELTSRPAARPVKAIYDLATLGSKTLRGGEVVTASTGMVIDKHRIACVGDSVRYPDGSEARIVSGAGFALTFERRPAAIVGSAIDNGDVITTSRQASGRIREYADGDSIPGLLQAGYLAPENSSRKSSMPHGANPTRDQFLPGT